jgi:hypothetical protein
MAATGQASGAADSIVPRTLRPLRLICAAIAADSQTIGSTGTMTTTTRAWGKTSGSGRNVVAATTAHPTAPAMATGPQTRHVDTTQSASRSASDAARSASDAARAAPRGTASDDDTSCTSGLTMPILASTAHTATTARTTTITTPDTPGPFAPQWESAGPRGGCFQLPAAAADPEEGDGLRLHRDGRPAVAVEAHRGRVGQRHRLAVEGGGVGGGGSSPAGLGSIAAQPACGPGCEGGGCGGRHAASTPPVARPPARPRPRPSSTTSRGTPPHSRSPTAATLMARLRRRPTVRGGGFPNGVLGGGSPGLDRGRRLPMAVPLPPGLPCVGSVGRSGPPPDGCRGGNGTGGGRERRPVRTAPAGPATRCEQGKRVWLRRQSRMRWHPGHP